MYKILLIHAEHLVGGGGGCGHSQILQWLNYFSCTASAGSAVKVHDKETIGDHEWRPLLTVETEVNGVSKSTDVRGPSLVMFVGLVVPVQETLFCLGCSSWPSTKYIFLTIHHFNSFVPIAQQAGHAAMLGRLSLSMSLWKQYTICITWCMNVGLIFSKNGLKRWSLRSSWVWKCLVRHKDG